MAGVISNLMERLPDSGVEATFYGRADTDGAWSQPLGKIRAPLPKPRAVFYGRRSLRRLVRTCREHRIDLLHAHSAYRAGWAAWLVKKAVGLPYVVTSHGDLHADSSRTRRAHFRRIVGKVLDEAAAVTHLTPTMARYAVLIRDVSFKSTIIPNGIDCNWWQRAPADAPRDHADGYVLALGRLVRKKGFHILVEAMASLARRGCSVPLVIAGTGDYEQQLRSQAKKAGLAALNRMEDLPLEGTLPCVCFPGFVTGDAKRSLFAGARLVAFPSHEEPFGLVQLEAMAAGKALVSSDIPSSRDFLVPGRNAWLVPPLAPEAWADAIAGLLRDEASRREIEQANRVDAGRFDWSQVAGLYAEVYGNALAT